MEAVVTDRAARIEGIREQARRHEYILADDVAFLFAEVTRLEQEIAWLKGKRRRRRNERTGRRQKDV